MLTTYRQVLMNTENTGFKYSYRRANPHPYLLPNFLRILNLFSVDTGAHRPRGTAVDLAAKLSLLSPTINDPSSCPTYDLKSYYRSLILSSWHDFWSSLSSNKLQSIKKFPIPWSSSNCPSRREEVVLACFRIGHTRLTHSFLYLGLFSPLHTLSLIHISEPTRPY